MNAPNHYENFPVGSIVLPRRLRRPIHAVYAFARYADDLADEGDATPEERKSSLHFLACELDKIGAGQTPETVLMQRLQAEAVAPFSLPLQPFYDLLSAFEQDTHKTRYQHFGELVDYSRRSANPVGRIILHLYGQTDPQSVGQSDGICTALQLINFWQDVAEKPRLPAAGRYGEIRRDRRRFGCRLHDARAAETAGLRMRQGAQNAVCRRAAGQTFERSAGIRIAPDYFGRRPDFAETGGKPIRCFPKAPRAGVEGLLAHAQTCMAEKISRNFS